MEILHHNEVDDTSDEQEDSFNDTALNNVAQQNSSLSVPVAKNVQHNLVQPPFSTSLLSNCIIDSSDEAEYVSFVMSNYQYKVYIRPHLREFLQTMSKFFDIYLYTHGTDKYARKVLDHLFPNHEDAHVIQGIFARQSSTAPRSLKQLHKMLCKRGASIIVDDRIDVWCKDDMDNVLQVAPFLGSAKDDDLAFLLKHLKRIHSFFFAQQQHSSTPVDVRDVLKYLASDDAQLIMDSDDDEEIDREIIDDDSDNDNEQNDLMDE